LEAQTAVPAWSFAADLGRSAASWVPLTQNSTQHTLTGRIKKIQRRLWDLLPVVRNHVYHPAFAGSYSLKAVLPALVPDMTYEGMVVADGTDTGLAWESLIRGGLDQVERDKIRKALLEYCGQDTLALVKLVETLRSVLE
jgi:predicted RecB family nuclease